MTRSCRERTEMRQSRSPKEENEPGAVELGRKLSFVIVREREGDDRLRDGKKDEQNGHHADSVSGRELVGGWLHRGDDVVAWWFSKPDAFGCMTSKRECIERHQRLLAAIGVDLRLRELAG